MAGGFTLGLDLGDRSHYVCVLDAQGQIIHEGPMLNERVALALFAHPVSCRHRGAGSGHAQPVDQPVSDEPRGRGHRGLIRASSTPSPATNAKCDRRDAVMLARLARADVALLHPLQHGSAQAQLDLLGLKLRDSLVRTRVNLINTVRFTLKSLGQRGLPILVRSVSQKHLNRRACRVSAGGAAGACRARPDHTTRSKFGTRPGGAQQTRLFRSRQRLQQIAGVGPLTALCFVLKIGEPTRFGRSRDVGPYLGLCPGRDQSGGTDKQLRISKCADGLLRRLLVSAAHYILGPFGPACALRRLWPAPRRPPASAKRNARWWRWPANCVLLLSLLETRHGL